MVYIVYEMIFFLFKDVIVYFNCDEVWFIYNKGGKIWIYIKLVIKEGMFLFVIIFKDIYDFMIDKNMFMRKKK